MSPDAISAAAGKAKLEIMGATHWAGETVVLLGPEEPGFWMRFTASAEYADGGADPLDRWSRRVIGGLADALGGRAVFPSDGPPYPPFLEWAQASGRAHTAPVGLLVHDRAGLWLSFRGALIVPGEIALPAPAPNPCIGCAAPCLSACPVGAMGETGYDVAACHAWLDKPGGQDCMARGCAVRRACPAGAAYGRVDAQSAFHMRAFHS